MDVTNKVSNEQPKFKSSVWRPTAYLRWHITEIEAGELIQSTNKTLQQKWESLSGEEEWRDIKIEVN